MVIIDWHGRITPQKNYASRSDWVVAYLMIFDRAALLTFRQISEDHKPIKNNSQTIDPSYL